MKSRRSVRRRPVVVVILILLVLGGGLLVPAWLFPGHIECRGYAEPVDWCPLYVPAAGIVSEGFLIDGKVVSEGEVLLGMDDEAIRYNIARIEGAMDSLEQERGSLLEGIAGFRMHRDVEAAELERLLDADRRLAAASTISVNQLRQTEYALRVFLAAAGREEAEYLGRIEQNALDHDSFRIELNHWMRLLEDCLIRSPSSGTFYTAETVFSGERAVFLPPAGPGRRLETGELLGFVVPGGDIRIQLFIPAGRVVDCRTGQRVLLTPDGRSDGLRLPLEGRIESLCPVASGGQIQATAVIVDDPGGGIPLCGNLSARIDTRDNGNPNFTRGLWERWVFLVNPAGDA